MNGTGGFQLLLTRLAGRRATGRPAAFHQTPEAERLRSALDMHDLGVKLYQQRMRREHPDAGHKEIDGLVRSWLAAPRPTRGCACRRESTVASPVELEFRKAVADLDALRVRWALIGGLAISVRSVPRFTKDLDFAVAVADDSEAEGVSTGCAGAALGPGRGRQSASSGPAGSTESRTSWPTSTSSSPISAVSRA